MIELRKLVSYADDFLAAGRFRDFCPNGLQVEGRRVVRRVASAVTSCLICIEKAAAMNADVLLVHHGLFWNKESQVVVGMKSRRLRLLLAAQINLVAYHLPLDVHPQVGNNARLAAMLPVNHCEALPDGGEQPIAMRGMLEKSMRAEDFGRLLSETLNRKALFVSGGSHEIRSLAWCSGAAQNLISLAASHDLDAFISGEISEQTTHIAREEGIHYFAAGHHATERYGVQALAEHLAERFSLESFFIDIDNPA